ncbi:putative 3',5'-cyclic-nucleotide phosphodiesterase regA [Blattamonas nauphoetae]|uniref:Phosphodiesterase n=1 Tax=Blattamonas nauphoetae TaxID=2049346 RepID=A0ABQ9XJA9_9EUKA|nr:putative 3',5'-cyclic-nucleotide phosphodiesterase regA [Blattamonas nauphoetae]
MNRTFSHREHDNQYYDFYEEDETSFQGPMKRRQGNSRMSTTDRLTRGNLSGRASRVSKEMAKQRIDDEYRQTHTFTPTIDENSRKLASKDRPSSRQRITELSKDSVEKHKKLEKIRKESEKDNEKECTFRPTINKSGKKSQTGTRFEDRLYEDATVRTQRLNEMIKRKEEQAEVDENPEYTFHPNVNPELPSYLEQYLEQDGENGGYTYISSIPLFERAAILQREKMEKINQRRAQEEYNTRASFKPKINKTSKHIMEQTPRFQDALKQNDVVSRMEVIEEQARLEKQRKILEEQEKFESVFTPTPQINPISNEIAKTSGLFHGSNKDFLRRQEVLNERSHQKKLLLQNKIHEQEVSGDIPTKRLPKSQIETAFENLAKNDVERRRMEQQAMEENENMKLRQETVPKINAKSAELMKNRTFKDILEDTGREEAIARAREQVEQDLARTCTFTPKTSRQRGGPSLEENIQRTERLKEEELAKERRRREYEELKDCTFKPQILSYENKEKDRVVYVRGLWRHLELQDMARKKIAEKQEHELRVFTPGSSQPRSGKKPKPRKPEQIKAEVEEDMRRSFEKGKGVLSNVMSMGGSGMGVFRKRMQEQQDILDDESSGDSLDSLLGLKERKTPKRTIRKEAQSKSTPMGHERQNVLLSVLLKGEGGEESADVEMDEWLVRMQQRRERVQEEEIKLEQLKLQEEERLREEEEARLRAEEEARLQEEEEERAREKARRDAEKAALKKSEKDEKRSAERKRRSILAMKSGRKMGYTLSPRSNGVSSLPDKLTKIKAIILSASEQNGRYLGDLCESISVSVLAIISSGPSIFQDEDLVQANILLIDASYNPEQYTSFLTTIRTNHNFRTLPILVLYSHEFFSTTILMIKTGADDAIAYPTNSSSFSDSLTHFFRQRYLEQTLKPKRPIVFPIDDDLASTDSNSTPTEDDIWALTTSLFQSLSLMMPFSANDVHTTAIKHNFKMIRDTIEECLVCIKYCATTLSQTSDNPSVTQSPGLPVRQNSLNERAKSPMHSQFSSILELTMKRTGSPNERTTTSSDPLPTQTSMPGMSFPSMGLDPMESFKKIGAPRPLSAISYSTTLPRPKSSTLPVTTVGTLPKSVEKQDDPLLKVPSTNFVDKPSDTSAKYPSLRSLFDSLIKTESNIQLTSPLLKYQVSPFNVPGFELTRLSFFRLDDITSKLPDLLCRSVVVPFLTSKKSDTQSALPSSLIKYQFTSRASVGPVPPSPILTIHAHCLFSKTANSTNDLTLLPLPSDIFSLNFDSLLYSTEELKRMLTTILACLNLSPQTQFRDISVVTSFVECVCSLYSPYNPYHNFHHAFDVTQMILAFLHNMIGTSILFSDMDIFALVLACVCHDVEHPGNNNVFQANSGSLAAQITNDQSVLESYSIIRSWSLFTDPSISPFGVKKQDKLKQTDEKERTRLEALRNSFRTKFVQCVLATDMADHMRYCQRLGAQGEVIAEKVRKCAIVESEWVRHMNQKDAEREWREEERDDDEVKQNDLDRSDSLSTLPSHERHSISSESRHAQIFEIDKTHTINYYLSHQTHSTYPSILSLRDSQFREETDSDLLLFIMKVLIKSADISNMSRSFPIALKWSERMMHEMLFQKQLEEKMKLPISVNTKPFAEMEVGFSVFVVEPFFTLFDKAIPSFSTVFARLQHNITRWKEASSKNKTFSEIMLLDEERVCDPGEIVKEMRAQWLEQNKAGEETGPVFISVFQSDLVKHYL